MNDFIVVLPQPPSVNECWKNVPGRGRVKTAKYKAWRKEAELTCRTLKPPLFDKPCSVFMRVAFRNVRSDIDGIVKPVLDALEAARVLENDRFVWRLVVEREHPVDASGWIIVKVEEMP